MRIGPSGYASILMHAYPIHLRTSLSACAVLCCLSAWASDQPQTNTKTILIINPDGVLSDNVQVVDRAMYDVFAGSPQHTEILSQHVVTRPGVENEAEILALVKEKYQGRHIDLIIARGEPALDFVERNGDYLWPGTPAMFFSIPATSIYWRARPLHKSGIFIDDHYADTLALIRRLQPSVHRIIQMNVPGADEEKQMPQTNLSSAAKSDLAIETLPEMPLPTLLKRVGELPNDTALLVMAIEDDRDALLHSAGNTLKTISTATNTPMYGLHESYIGNGVVGGQVPDLVSHGRQAAKLALELLAHPDAAPIFQITRQSNCVVDNRQLMRWQFDPNTLPQQCERRFYTPTYWDRFGWQIMTFIFMLAAILGLLLLLQAQRRRRIGSDNEAVRQRTALAHVARLGSVGELTASIVHEINQPLGAILANVDAATMMLMQQKSHDKELVAILMDIRHDDMRASQIIQKLRTLLSKRTLELIPLSLNEIIDASKSLFGNLAIRHHSTLQVQLGENLPLIMGDSTHLQQVLTNLISNAMEAMSQFPPEQRILTLMTGTDEAGFVLLKISDYGPGIPIDVLPNIFDSFYTTKQDGMGMGLAIVQTIVHAHHGHIEVSNNPQGGATFRIRIPGLSSTTVSTFTQDQSDRFLSMHFE
ncbi:ATP-binding protein [Glaciimonas soli]|uniref:histidine kinase n=1 Tax=Glaciimonas soli TaxID=2590999 RepID=A0A843YSP7_9BURK|nr:ATP-binding protein [Glaciimonas soli]MQR01007.1 GHKL domain-containing protein [Glaciimonas soli]